MLGPICTHLIKFDPSVVKLKKYQLLKMSTLGSGVLAASKIPILVLCGPSGSGKVGIY